MEQNSTHGALRISHNTYARSRAYLQGRCQDLAHQGIDKPYSELSGLSPPSMRFHPGRRGIEGVATRIISGDTELWPADTFKRLFVRQARTVSVVADARHRRDQLLHEFAVSCERARSDLDAPRGAARADPGPALRTFARHFYLALAARRRRRVRRPSARRSSAAWVRCSCTTTAPTCPRPCPCCSAGFDRHRVARQPPRQGRSTTSSRSATARSTWRSCSSVPAPPIDRLPCSGFEALHGRTTRTLDFLACLVEIDRDLPLLLLAFSRPDVVRTQAGEYGEQDHRGWTYGSLART